MKLIDWRFEFLSVIGIITVVLGHCGGGGINLLAEWFPYYSFHMGLFAFISGYLFKEDSADCIVKFVVHKIKKLIVPFYLWNIFYWLFTMFLGTVGFRISSGQDHTWLYNLLIQPVFNSSFSFNLAGWFVIPLFLIQVYTVLIRKALRAIRIKNSEWLIFVFHFLLGVFGVYLANRGYQKSWHVWIMIVRFLCILPFFEMGVLYKSKLEKIDNFSNIFYLGFIFVAALTIITTFGHPIQYVLMWCVDLPDNPFIMYLVGILGIALWLRIAKIMEPIVKESKIIKLIGDNTFSIMINQYLGFFLVKSVFYVISAFTSFCSDFDVLKYKTDYDYFYLPGGGYKQLVFCLCCCRNCGTYYNAECN